MCPVGSAESIVYEYIAKGCQIFGECFAVLGFFCAVTGIFKQNNFPVLHGFYSCFCVRPYDFWVCCKFYFLP